MFVPGHRFDRRRVGRQALCGLLVGLLLTAAAAWADEDEYEEGDAPPAPAVQGATLWAEGLASPQGLVLHEEEVWVVEHDAGRICRYDLDGTFLGVVADGLQTPAFARLIDGLLWVGERQGNRVLTIDAEGTVTPVASEVIDPLGVWADPDAPGGVFVLSHRDSAVYRLIREGGEPIKVAEPADGARYGARAVAVGPDGLLYVSDERTNAVLRGEPGGTLEPWAEQLGGPSGLAFDADGRLYVTTEGDGRLRRLDPVSPDGAVEVLASGLGQAREVLLLPDGRVLVSDRRGGHVWVVTPEETD